MPPETKFQRLQFEINTQDAQAVRELIDETGCSSLADLMRRSLVWYKDTFDAWSDGQECVFRSADGTVERVPMLGALFGRIVRPASKSPCGSDEPAVECDERKES